ncbi:E3 ubiquitin-protein ligase TM129-like [Montipora capricornis]|uniref:E3 ubiquitin-protein ligase TM129-like n=1 Tax=Montipora capricornis TaxID=246305 RepID=UPI0035F136C4
MEEMVVVFTIAYVLVSLCFIAPPREFVSAGLTVQNILSSYLGSEDIDFVGYHLKRTTATLLLHSLLPLGYYVCLGLVSPDLHLFEPARTGLAENASLLLCLSISLCGALCARYWSWKYWSKHPFAQLLLKHGSPWRAVASSVNIEFRRITKFSSIIGGTSLYITDSWIIKCSAYKVDIAHQPDVHLSIIHAEDHDISHESSVAVQFLNIRVASITPGVKSFVIRLNSTDYGDLREKLQAPIRNARNVVIHQSLSDRFIDAFKEQVSQNERYQLQEGEEDPEPCIGCMQAPADIKLRKLCATAGEGECVPCYCRPMWCIDCMGKWYASRQDQHEPEGWLASTSPCPTCRAKFCMLDVCLISRSN